MSIRVHMLGIVLFGAIVPMMMIGLWLTGSALRSGEALLQQHLAEAADLYIGGIDARWLFRQSDLALFAENASTATALATGRLPHDDSLYLSALFAGMQSDVPVLRVRDVHGTVRWMGAAPRPATRPRAFDGTTFSVQFPVVVKGEQVGSVAADVRLASVRPADAERPGVPASRVAIREASTKQVLVPLLETHRFPSAGTFAVNGQSWMSVHRHANSAPLEIVVAAPLVSYTGPFLRAGQIGILAVGAMALLALTLTTVLTNRLATRLGHVADSADAVSQGDLARTVDEGGPHEIHRLSHAFNIMTASLRHTMDELSERSALAAIGEFATSLSHEVRNALTSIKLDMQRAVRKPSDDPAHRDLMLRALRNVARLEAAVSGALRAARGANVAHGHVDLGRVLRASMEAVAGYLAAVPAEVILESAPGEHCLRGDATALEQLFTNLLFNAGQAVRPGGEVRIAVTASVGAVRVSITDNGAGMTADQIRATEGRFQSSKPYGTGLGLPIARRIASTHGGSIEITSELSVGTSVVVTFGER